MKSRFRLAFVFGLTLLALLGAPACAEGPSEAQRAAGRELAKRIAAAVERYPLGDVTGWFETLGVEGGYVISTNRNLIHIFAGGPKYNFEYPLSGEGGVSVGAFVISVAKNSLNNRVEIILGNNRKTCLMADDLLSFFSPERPPNYFKGAKVFSPSAAAVLAERDNRPDLIRFAISSVDRPIQVLTDIRYFEGYSCLQDVYLSYVD